MLRILGTIFAALLGLCFGSFLNVCLSRWPAGESIAHPRSHCRSCARTLTWWENIPLVSWIALRGRCRTCGTWVSIRYPLVEVAVAGLWSAAIWRSVPGLPELAFTEHRAIAVGVGLLVFLWILTALAILDAENLWLPDRLTLPGIMLGFAYSNAIWMIGNGLTRVGTLRGFIVIHTGEILIAAAIILLIRWLYWILRRREGLGLGDAKLMAMLAAWLGLPGALLSLFIGVVVGSIVAVTALVRRPNQSRGSWAALQLPLGTFLCIGGIVSALWGEQILAAYLRWSGF